MTDELPTFGDWAESKGKSNEHAAKVAEKKGERQMFSETTTSGDSYHPDRVQPPGCTIGDGAKELYENEKHY